jgi:hypothetical protein
LDILTDLRARDDARKISLSIEAARDLWINAIRRMPPAAPVIRTLNPLASG